MTDQYLETLMKRHEIDLPVGLINGLGMRIAFGRLGGWRLSLVHVQTFDFHFDCAHLQKQSKTCTDSGEI